MSIAARATALALNESGIWVSQRATEISYPASGNEECYAMEDASYWFRHRNDCIVAAIRRFPPPGPILDIGGGNGFVARRLLDEGFATSVLEPGMQGAWNAKKQRAIPEVICSTLSNAGLSAESLAAAGCFDVIEHIDDDHSFLVDLHRILQPDGMLYLTVPAHGWLWSSSDVSAGHYRRYARVELNRLLRKLGFEPLFASYIFGMLTLPVLLFRALPFRLAPSKEARLLSSNAEHGTQGGLYISAIESLLRREARQIAQGVELGVGTSVLAVARKLSR